MHDFLAWNRCFVVRCSASRRSSRRCSPILRSTKRIKLFSLSSSPNSRNFPFIRCPPNHQVKARFSSYLRHKWIEFISKSGCLWLSRKRLSEQSNPSNSREFEASLDVAPACAYSKKKPQGWEPCSFY